MVSVPRSRKHYRWWGIEVTRGTARIGAQKYYSNLADFDFEALGLGVTGRVGDGQRVDC